MPPVNYVCTWVYVEDKDDTGIYPQLGMSPGAPAAQDVYWRCMVVLFESLNRSTTDSVVTKFLLFTNVPNLPHLDGIDLKSYLAQLGVTIVTTPYTWRPAGKRRLWLNQYYIFDILSYAMQLMGED